MTFCKDRTNHVTDKKFNNNKKNPSQKYFLQTVIICGRERVSNIANTLIFQRPKFPLLPPTAKTRFSAEGYQDNAEGL